MKKAVVLVTLLMLLLPLSSCTQSAQGLTLSLDSGGNYTGFSDLPSGYTAEQAEKDGCYVRVQFETVCGEEKWGDFVEQAAKGNDTSIRIVSFCQNGLCYDDLFYVDGYYRVFNSQFSDLQDHPFSCLRKLEGRMPNAARDDIVTILTDDESLKYKDVMGTFLSSDSHYAETISPFELIFIE